MSKRGRADGKKDVPTGKRQRTLLEAFSSSKCGKSGGGGGGTVGEPSRARGADPAPRAAAAAPARCLLVEARAAMSMDAVIDGPLPCREGQSRAIEAFVRGAVARGGLAYVTGAPGTGKTACVVRAARCGGGGGVRACVCCPARVSRGGHGW
jgi:hypothetical protein